MSATTSSSRTSTIVGIVLGALILVSMVLFSVVLPDATGAEDSDEVKLSLPDTLPGGYAAADLAASFEDSELADQADLIAEQQAAATAYGDEVLPKALDTEAVTRSYVINGTEPVFVQVFHAEGGAFSPTSLTDPQTTGGAGGVTMSKIGDGACIITTAQLQPGQEGAQTSSECQVSRGDITVQVSSHQVSAEDLVKLADAVFEVAVQS